MNRYLIIYSTPHDKNICNLTVYANCLIKQLEALLADKFILVSVLLLP